MPLAVAARKSSSYPDITEPRACLARIGVHIRGSVHVPPPDIPPAVWKCYGPLYLVTKTLAEHGLIELPEHGRDVFNPTWWRAATRRLPDRTRRVIWKHVHPWAKREWLDGGTAWLQALSHEIFSPVGG